MRITIKSSTFVIVVAVFAFQIFDANGTMECIPANKILKFNPSTLEDVRKCWNLDNGRIVQSVDILENWITKQNHFVNKSFSRSYLEITLITCKGSVEKAKSQIDKLCTFRTLLPKFFISGDVRKTLADILKISFIIPLPKLTKDNYRTVILKVNFKDVTSADYIVLYQLTVVLCEYLKAHDYSNGYIVIHDYMDTNLMEVLTKVNIVEFQQSLTIFIEGFGARVKGIHLLSKSSAIDLFVKTVKPLLTSKLADRIHVHQDIEALHSVVDKNLLPVEYGGEERSIEILKNEWLDVLSSEENEKYLAVMKESCTDETLRSSSKYNEQVMGLPGSFRTLSMD